MEKKFVQERFSRVGRSPNREKKGAKASRKTGGNSSHYKELGLGGDELAGAVTQKKKKGE